MDISFSLENSKPSNDDIIKANALLSVAAPSWYPSKSKHNWSMSESNESMAGIPENTEGIICNILINEDKSFNSITFISKDEVEYKKSFSPMQEIRINSLMSPDTKSLNPQPPKHTMPTNYYDIIQDFVNSICNDINDESPDEIISADYSSIVPVSITNQFDFYDYMKAVTSMLIESIKKQFKLLEINSISLDNERFGKYIFLKMTLDEPSDSLVLSYITLNNPTDTIRFEKLPYYVIIGLAESVFPILDDIEINQ